MEYKEKELQPQTRAYTEEKIATILRNRIGRVIKECRVRQQNIHDIMKKQ